MSFSIIPVKDTGVKERKKLSSAKEQRNIDSYMSIDEYWVVGAEMVKTGQLYRFKLYDKYGNMITDMRWFK